MYTERHLSAEQIELIDDRVSIQLPTPLLNLVEVPRFSITAALLMLHVQQCRAAVVGALDGLRDYQVNQRVLVELLICYDMPSALDCSAGAVHRWPAFLRDPDAHRWRA